MNVLKLHSLLYPLIGQGDKDIKHMNYLMFE